MSQSCIFFPFFLLVKGLVSGTTLFLSDEEGKQKVVLFLLLFLWGNILIAVHLTGLMGLKQRRDEGDLQLCHN